MSTNSLKALHDAPKDSPHEPVDWNAVPVMEDVRRFFAGGKAWSVQEIKLVSAYGEWEEVTIIGVRPSDKVDGVFDLIEVRGAAPRKDFDRDLSGGADDWNPPART